MARGPERVHYTLWPLGTLERLSYLHCLDVVLRMHNDDDGGPARCVFWLWVSAGRQHYPVNIAHHWLLWFGSETSPHRLTFGHLCSSWWCCLEDCETFRGKAQGEKVGHRLGWCSEVLESGPMSLGQTQFGQLESRSCQQALLAMASVPLELGAKITSSSFKLSLSGCLYQWQKNDDDDA